MFETNFNNIMTNINLNKCHLIVFFLKKIILLFNTKVSIVIMKNFFI